MTAITALGRVAPAEQIRRCEIGRDLLDAANWITYEPGSIIPAGTMTVQLPVPPGLTHEQKLGWVREVAESWKVDPAGDGDGGLRAVKEFGQVRFVASVGPDSSARLIRRQDALRRETAVAA